MKGKKKFKAAALMLSLIMAFGLTGGVTFASDDTTGYTVTFSVDEGITIDIYYTQDYTTASETNVTSAVARDSNSGEVDISGDGQVNFKVNVADGYTLGTVSASGGYKNLKDSSDTGEDGVYRLTKITGAATVTVTATKDSAGEEDDTDDTEESTYTTTSYEEDASLNLELANSISIGSKVNADGGVAEIVAYNSDTSTAYAVNGQDGKLYYFSVASDGLTLKGSLDVSTLIEDEADGFTYGDLTSVAVDTVNDHIALAVQAYNYYDNGRVLLLDYDLNVITTFETGVQPDMVTFTPDGSCILTADEGEPREGYGVGAQDPAGTVTIIDLEKETITYVGFEMYSEDTDTLLESGALVRINNGSGGSVYLDPKYDLEPEYIAVSSDGSTAYVSLQEANAVAIIDIEKGTLKAVTGLGFKDLTEEENAVDLQDDSQYLAWTYSGLGGGIYGVYMPDSISVYEACGVTYLVTANEGDVSEWGVSGTNGYYTNEKSVTLTDADGNTTTVQALDYTYVAGLEDEGSTYLFGGRSFAIYKVNDDYSLTQVYESGNDFEEITAEYLSTWFNCSNDDVEIDSRSMKKGVEPEGVAIGTIGDKTYAFIGLERIGGIMVYDITDPSNVSYVNYINTRDFSEDILGDVSPEGLAFAVLSDGTPMLLVAYEVSGTVAAYTFTDADGEAVTAASSSASYDAYTVEEHNSYEITTQQDATCTQDGYITYTCSFCNDTYTDVLEATGHTESEAVQENVVDATCETDGSYDSVVYCSVCGAEISRETVTTEATGHDYDYASGEWTWTETDDGYTATYTVICKNDSSHTSAFEATVTSGVTEATCTTDGYTTYTATVTVDGTEYTDSKQGNTIAATGHSYDSEYTESYTLEAAEDETADEKEETDSSSANTGDENNLFFWLCIACLAFMGIFAASAALQRS